MAITNEEAIAEVWQLFRETAARFKETDAQMDKRSAETDARMDKRSAETDARFKETDARMDKRFAETDARMDKRSAETNKKIDKLAGTFGQQWGRLIEALVRPDSIRLFQQRGIQIEFVTPRMKRERGRDTMEIDLLLLNKDELVIIEVKSTLKVDHVQDFLKDLAEFKHFFPEYQAYRVYGAVAGLEIVGQADKMAYRQGLFVLAVTGQDLVEIRNDSKFKPKDFGIPS